MFVKLLVPSNYSFDDGKLDCSCQVSLCCGYKLRNCMFDIDIFGFF